MPHLTKQSEPSDSFFPGGLFLHSDTLPTSFTTLIPSSSSSSSKACTVSCFSWVPSPRKRVVSVSGIGGGHFLSLSLSINGSGGDHQRHARESVEIVEEHEKKVCEEKENHVGVSNGSGAMNMTRHLWAGAVAAMVSRYSFLILSNNHVGLRTQLKLSFLQKIKIIYIFSPISCLNRQFLM